MTYDNPIKMSQELKRWAAKLMLDSKKRSKLMLDTKKFSKLMLDTKKLSKLMLDTNFNS
jgi:hypothetical protein